MQHTLSYLSHYHIINLILYEIESALYFYSGRNLFAKNTKKHSKLDIIEVVSTFRRFLSAKFLLKDSFSSFIRFFITYHCTIFYCNCKLCIYFYNVQEIQLVEVRTNLIFLYLCMYNNRLIYVCLCIVIKSAYVLEFLYIIFMIIKRENHNNLYIFLLFLQT